MRADDTSSTRASDGASARQRADERVERAGRPLHLDHDAAAVVEHEAGQALRAGQPVDERPESDALDDTAHLEAPALQQRSHRGRGLRAHSPLRPLDEVAEQVVGGRLGLLDARDVLRRRQDDVVGETLGGDAAAVVADQRDGAQPAAAGLDQGGHHAARVAARRQRQQRVAARAVRDHLAGEDRVGADVVGDRGQDRRVGGQVERTARPPAGGGGRRREVGDEIHGIGGGAAVADREQRAAGREHVTQRAGGRVQLRGARRGP